MSSAGQRGPLASTGATSAAQARRRPIRGLRTAPKHPDHGDRAASGRHTIRGEDLAIVLTMACVVGLIIGVLVLVELVG